MEKKDYSTQKVSSMKAYTAATGQDRLEAKGDCICVTAPNMSALVGRVAASSAHGECNHNKNRSLHKESNEGCYLYRIVAIDIATSMYSSAIVGCSMHADTVLAEPLHHRGLGRYRQVHDVSIVVHLTLLGLHITRLSMYLQSWLRLCHSTMKARSGHLVTAHVHIACLLLSF